MNKLNTNPPCAVDAQNEYQIQLSQRKIIEAIEHELSLEDEFYKPQSMFHSVWFFPERGMFMYAEEIESIDEISDDEARKVMVRNDEFDEDNPDDMPEEISVYDLSVGEDFAIIASTEFY